jgi:hypothetical protein
VTVKVVLGYGLGVDSTAILLRWIHEPGTRPCDLSELLVVTAMTGNEWQETGRLVREHMLPLMRLHGIRYVQIARKGPSRAFDGYTVLSDSAAPAELFLDGAYKLGDEMNDNGTVPQVGGTRKCSIKAKGEPLDDFLADELGEAPFLHAIGFEANEPKRAKRDKTYDTEVRSGFYPLIEWGWDRATCEAYITGKTGAAWIKSACTFCPFALTNCEGRARVGVMAIAEPASMAQALATEYRSIALNPSQGLMAKGSLLDMLRRSGRTYMAALQEFGMTLAGGEWRIYEVQRVIVPARSNPAKTFLSRSVRSIAAGTRSEMHSELEELAAAEGIAVETGELAVHRAYMSRRGDGVPAYERLYVVAPAGVQDKESKAFRNALAAYLGHMAALEAA